MSYTVKEIFYTLQGEGANTGRPSVFCRFSGCNLWSGQEEHRATASCSFCDTDFVGYDGINGGKFSSAAELVKAISKQWPSGTKRPGTRPFVVCTGGEPLLQLDAELVDCLHSAGLEIAVETNGTIKPPKGIDWTCVSPKAGTLLTIRTGDELKLVFPQCGADPSFFESLGFRYFFLQPMDGPAQKENLALAVRYCLDHPTWRLSLQTHKLLGIR